MYPPPVDDTAYQSESAAPLMMPPRPTPVRSVRAVEEPVPGSSGTSPVNEAMVAMSSCPERLAAGYSPLLHWEIGRL